MNDNKIIYLFEIEFENSKKYFCSINEKITHNNIEYLPYSNLSIVEASFNDSAKNIINISGDFEKEGINKSDNLLNIAVNIKILQNNRVNDFVTNYICTEYIQKDLKFNLKCETQILKYNKQIVPFFSKTCRANLGDKYCKINLDNYSFQAIINDIVNNIIFIDEIRKFEDNYFKNGILKISNDCNNQYKYLQFNIDSQVKNKVVINCKSKQLGKYIGKIANLLPNCDKTFKSCCYKFNNRLNFRGEPYIPEDNIIKN